MKRCSFCAAKNSDGSANCHVCGGANFIPERAAATRPAAAPAAATPAAALPWISIGAVIGLCLLFLAGEAGWRQAKLNQLAARFAQEQARLEADRTLAVAAAGRAAQARLDQAGREQQSLLADSNWRSGTLARQRHAAEWALRQAHDPRLARTALETNLLAMEQFGRDPSLAAQAALEKVAQLSAPPDSRVAVVPAGDGFIVRVAFLMSRLSPNEAGAVTKHHSTGAMRAEIQGLSARVLRDLYSYCGSRGIQSISVTCNHTLRQTMVPFSATPEEKRLLLERAPRVCARLFKVSLGQDRARTVVDWPRAPLAQITELATVEYDGLKTLTINQNSAAEEDPHDAAGTLQF